MWNRSYLEYQMRSEREEVESLEELGKLADGYVLARKSESTRALKPSNSGPKFNTNRYPVFIPQHKWNCSVVYG